MYKRQILNTGTIQNYEGSTADVPNNEQARFQALHNMFVASAKAVSYTHLIAGAGLSILKLVVFQGNVVALASVNWAGVLIFVAAFVALRMFKINPILTMLCCGAANLFVNLFC